MGVCSAQVGSSLVCSVLVGSCLVCSALVGSCLVCSALVGSGLVCSTLVGSGLVCSVLVSFGLVCPTWTWPSVSSPDSTSAPPPYWIVLCVERLEAALWEGGGGSVTNPVHELTPTHLIVSCTTLQLHITHGLHFPSTIALVTQLSPITH